MGVDDDQIDQNLFMDPLSNKIFLFQIDTTTLAGLIKVAKA